jgi:hypothetical protein
VERFERLERTDPHDEPSAAVEPFDKTQGRLLERLKRASVCVTTPETITPNLSHMYLNEFTPGWFFRQCWTTALYWSKALLFPINLNVEPVRR